MKKQMDKKNKTLIGLLWSFTDLMANQGIQFIIQIILARLLLPEHFGLIGMVLVFIALANSLVDSGFKQALIREKKVSQADYSTVFYFNIIISIVVYFTLFFLAPLIGEFFREAQLIKIVRILSLGIILNSLSLVPQAMLSREVDFKTQTKVNIISSMVSGVIGVTMALIGLGVWSLVLRTLCMNIIQAILFILAKRWIPSFVFSIVSFKKMFGFGSKLLISGLIDTVYQNIYYVIIGKQYSTTHLGYYTNATKLSDFTSRTLTLALQRVTYPVLSSLQDDHIQLKNAYRTMIRYSAFVFFPIIVGIIAIGEPLISLVFGNKWLPMIPYFQLLAFASMFFPISAINLNILKVKGKSNLFLYLEILKKVSFTILIVLALLLKTGIYGLLVAIILNSLFSLLINIYFSGREIQYSLMEQIKDILPFYILSLVMGVATLLLGKYIIMGNIMTITLQVILGIIVYILLTRFFKLKEHFLIYEYLSLGIKRYFRRKQ